jgi:hypothetical protein
LHGSSDREPTQQVQGPKFKAQYCKKEKEYKKELKDDLYINRHLKDVF